MTGKNEAFIDVDYILSKDESELVVKIRATDRKKLTQQDALDAFMMAIEECFGVEVTTVTKQEAEDDTNLH